MGKKTPDRVRITGENSPEVLWEGPALPVFGRRLWTRGLPLCRGAWWDERPDLAA